MEYFKQTNKLKDNLPGSTSSPPTFALLTSEGNPSSSPSLKLAADTGTTGHFVQQPEYESGYLAYDGPMFNIQPASNPISVTLPDNSTMTNTHEATLRIPGVSMTASKAYVFSNMASSLLSIGQLCDDGCIALFTKSRVTIIKDNAVILMGNRDPDTKLWVIDLNNAPTMMPMPGPNILQFAANSAIAKETVAERISYLHWCAGSPSLSTWCKAIDSGFYRSWPQLTSKLVRKHMPTSLPMIKGHLDQQRKNIRSTKPKRSAANPVKLPGTDETELDRHPAPIEHRTNFVFADCQPITGQIFSDQPGRFLVSSVSGNQYLMVVYDYDSNSIIAEPMKSRSGPEMLRAYQAIFDYLSKRGFRPQLQRLDNEASKELKGFMEEKEVDFQFTPTHSHRRNAAERAIRTFKNHFIAVLCGTDPNFPLILWDKLISQAVMTLNFLRASRVNPRLSAYEHLNGGFDFNRTPLGPLGCKVAIHEMPEARGTWSPHAVEGYYIGPAIQHYRCYNVWVDETKSERIANTLVWLPSMMPVPKTSSADAAVAAAQELIFALTNPHPASALAPLRDEHKAALETLSNIFATAVPEPSNEQSENPAQSPALPRVPAADSVQSQSFPVGTVIAKRFDDKNYRGEVTAFDNKYGYYKIQYEDGDEQEMNEREVGRYIVSDPSAPIPQPQQPPRVGKPKTFAEATNRRRQSRRKNQSPPISSKANYYDVLSSDEEAENGNDIADDATVVASNRSKRRSSRRAPRGKLSTPVADDDAFTFTEIEKPAAAAQPLGPLLKDSARRRPYRRRGYIPRRNPSNAIAAQLATHFANFATLPMEYHAANAVVHPDTGAVLEYRDLIKTAMKDQYIQANIDEIGRLTDGRVGSSKSAPSRTMEFVHFSKLPTGKKATYLRIVADLRPQKECPHRVRWTVGGDKIVYHGEVSTPTAEMITTKMLLNSVISTRGARFMTVDIRDFYLSSIMPEPEFMWVPVSLIPAEVMKAYNLHDKVLNGKVLVKINKGMYGLPQAGRLAQEQLIEHLKPFGYAPCKRTPGLWTHEWRPITFSLTVDDFGVKYVGKEHAQHLIESLEAKYAVTKDWDGKLYCGIQLDWNYNKRWVDLSMPRYVREMLHRFQHATPSRPEHAPYRFTRVQYGPGPQFAEKEDDSPLLDAKGINEIQQKVGSAYYYGRAIDSTIIPSLTSISAEQSQATERTKRDVNKLFDYLATHPHAKIRYVASDMILHVHSDASYLSAPKARSKLGGYFYLSAKPKNPYDQPSATNALPPLNGAIHINANIIKHVMSAASEAELGALFFNMKDAIPFRVALEEMGHPQPPTPIVVDNSTAAGVANKTVKQRRSKAMDMRFYWVQDRIEQKQFLVYWRKGAENLADYFTKHHPARYHVQMRPVYLHSNSTSNSHH